MPALSQQHNQVEYSVSELSAALKRVVEDTFGHVRLRGEISNWKGPHSSGHAYFRLKDENAMIEAVCWRGTLSKLGCRPEEGLEVVVTGRISTYPGKSNYQIVVETMEPAGIGALMALLQKRKEQLQAEGLFAPERKKPLPFLPQVIGVVTSPTGAVIRDILHRLRERFPVRVLVWPVAVQGEGAAEQIAAAIHGFNDETLFGERAGLPRPDVIIVARGGGSLEDLWAFNEEVVVRAAAASVIPLISAVGHETDTTLIDFASDRRAPTPTAAAEMAVPVRADLLLSLEEQGLRIQRAMLQRLTQAQERVEGQARGLPRPEHLLAVATQRLDEWSERLAQALPRLLLRKQQQLDTLAAGLQPAGLLRGVAREQKHLDELGQRLFQGAQRLLARRFEQVQQLEHRLESVNYQAVLRRGYALVRAGSGEIISSAAQAASGTSVAIVFHDGEQRAVIEGQGAKPAAKRSSTGAKKTDQPSLL